ncbi:MAG TPA: sigma factor, partial [Kofleriaceae bacterium]
MNLPCPALVGLPATVSARDVLADLDREVLELVRRGEVIAALRRILQCHGRGVFRFCREALRDPALAEDVHQQVFLAAFRALPRFQARSPVRSWLFAIARHRVLDAVRVRNRTRARIQDCETGDVPDPRPLQGEALD